MKTKRIFEVSELGSLKLKNRFVMAPMTRSRTSQPGDVPNDLMAKYYGQRADEAGLIISEATQISSQGKGYSFTPGIHTTEHIEGWKKITKEIHSKGGKIFCQLWHVGRMSHPSLHEDGQTVGPSALSPDAQVWIVGDDGQGRMVDCPVPRELSTLEVKNIVNDFRQAAKNAVEAGFDGVEIHGGNGYLIDQFMRRTSNKRSDEYGGSIENRIRFPYEVVKEIIDEIGADKVGIRLAPFIKQRGMHDDETPSTILELSKKLNDLKLAYVHLAEADWDDAPEVNREFRVDLRKIYSGKIIVAGNYTPEKGEELIESDLVDLVAFGRPFIANPDYPSRVKNNQKLSDFDPNSLFGGDSQGYTTYTKFGE